MCDHPVTTVKTTMPELILASTSPFRRQLLERLQIPFTCVAPAVDETALKGEDATQLVARLSQAKARAGAQGSQSLVIGSDQVAVVEGQILGKPGTPERAAAQLRMLAGQAVRFHTGVCVLNAATGTMHEDIVDTVVQMRVLDAETIARYLALDEPWGCAGSFRSESLGISLFESVRSDDPTALIGLPLIRVAKFLRAEGVDVP